MKRVGLHLLFWSAILFWKSNADYCCGEPIMLFVFHNLVRLPVIIVATYLVIYYLLPKYIFQEKQYQKFALLFLLNFIIASGIDQFLIESKLIYHAITGLGYQHKIFMHWHPFRSSFMLLSIIGLASLIRFFKLHLEEEKKRNQLQELQLQTKLAFLKSQVNPHFLFNALNNIYSMAVQKNQTEIASGLENLSGIMQYLTYESNSPFVPLKKEIDLLQNYIEIQNLRIADTDDTTINFQVNGDIEDKMIAPVILLPLVENAFKHGIDPEEKSLINIQLHIDQNTLFCTIKNSIFNDNKKGNTERGIGLDNVRERLDLVYPNQHQFTIQSDASFFLSKLQLDLRPDTNRN